MFQCTSGPLRPYPLLAKLSQLAPNSPGNTVQRPSPVSCSSSSPALQSYIIGPQDSILAPQSRHTRPLYQANTPSAFYHFVPTRATMCTTGYRRRDGQTFQVWFDSHIQGLLSAPSASSFSSTFSSMFGSDATGTVNGRAVDRGGVQRALRALSEKWDKTSGKVEKAKTTPGTDQNAAVKLIWKLDGKQVQVYCAACCCEDTGGTNIDDITLEGDASLFS